MPTSTSTSTPSSEISTTRIRRSAPRRRRFVAAGAMAMAAVTLAGCGLAASASYVPTAGPPPNVPGNRLKGVDLTVGSKQFTEQRLLGKMGVIVLRANGATVKDSTGIPGSAAARQAQLKGDVNFEFEYTGTAWVSYLGNDTGIPDQQKQYEAVRDADAKSNLVWLPPAPENNTYAFAIRKNAPAELQNIKSISDIKKLPPAQRTFCVESEFASRNDGFEPMLKTYGLPLGAPNGVPRSNVTTVDTGVVYTATAQGTCNFGEVFTTDGRILSLNLKVLEDDKKFFPAYNLAPVVNKEQFDKHPEIAPVIAPVMAALTDAEITELNRKVDVDGQEIGTVAYDWLKSKGFVS
jgi:osmoprotectant transport system substrate-binding protein